MGLRLVIGLGATAIALAIAGRRAWWLYRLIKSGQPATGRLDGVMGRLRTELTEVIGQRRLLKWSVPGLAHAFTFWGFLILGLTIVEAYGALFVADFAIPIIGHWPIVGFLEDFFAVAVLAGLATFTVLRLRQAPRKIERQSRFYGSHTGPAWQILGMITLVININGETGELKAPPKFVTQGVRGFEPTNGISKSAELVVTAALAGASRQTLADETLLKEHVRIELKRFIQKETGARPVIVPVIQQV